MATIGNTVATLADVAKSVDPDGKIARVGELLNQQNEMLDDLHWMEGNLPTGHRLTMRTGLPTVAWRLLNQGITPSKSLRAQVDEACGMLEGFCEVDVDLAKLGGNDAAYRASESIAFLEAMNQKFATTVFYGNSGLDPEQFTGLSVRYSSLSAGNAQNVISAGGSSSDTTSIWLTVSGPETFFALYPKGTTAGLQHKDLGEQVIQTGTGIGTGRMLAYVDHWQWKCGIGLKDWRYVVRICNIDVSDLIGVTGTQALTASTNILKLMARAIDRIPNFRMGRACFHANRTVASAMRLHGLDKSSSAVTVEDALDQFGNRQSGSMKFLGVPICTNDALLNTETVVS